MATATRRQCFCGEKRIAPRFNVRVKGSELAGWVDYVGRDRIRYRWGTVTVYVLQHRTANGREFYGRRTFSAPELELIDDQPTQPDSWQA